MIRGEGLGCSSLGFAAHQLAKGICRVILLVEPPGTILALVKEVIAVGTHTTRDLCWGVWEARLRAVLDTPWLRV